MTANFLYYDLFFVLPLFFVDDILATVLGLYMHDKKQPLPSHEEVLLCTPDTTTEEVQYTFRKNFSQYIFIFSYR